jgi:hypothetical protein
MKDLVDKHCKVDKQNGQLKKLIDASFERAKVNQFEKENRKTDKGLSAREAQARRNAEYFAKVRAGEVDDAPPMPVNYRPIKYWHDYRSSD